MNENVEWYTPWRSRDFVIPSEVEGSRSIAFGCSAEFLDYASLRSE